MSRFYLNDFEMEALAGLRHGAFRLYVVLRSRMNFTTGEVGRKPLISRWALREALYVEGKRGRAAVDSGTPTEQTVRGFELELEAAGLIAYRSIAHQKQLIFFLGKAETNQAQLRAQEVQQVSLEEQQSEVQQGQTEVGQWFAGVVQQSVQQSDAVELQQTSEYGVTEKTLNLLFIEKSSSSENVSSRASAQDDDGIVGEKIPQTPLTARHWWQLAIAAGFTAAQAGQDKAVAMYRVWVDLQVTQGEFDAALVRAVSARGGLPASPVYLAVIVQQLRSEVAAVQGGFTPGQKQLAGGGDKPWFVAGAYPVGDKAKSIPHLAALKQKFRTVQ